MSGETTSKADSNEANRFSPVTDQDQAGVLWIASLLAATYALLSILTRAYIKRKCYGLDDLVCLAAMVRNDSPSHIHVLFTCISLPLFSSFTIIGKLTVPNQIIGAGSFIATYVALSKGLGKSFILDPIQLHDISRVSSACPHPRRAS